MRSRTPKLALALVALIVAMSAFASTATASSRYFHTHIDAYSQTNNCGYSEWSSSLAYCQGYAQPTQNTGTMAYFIGISWCDGSSLASACLGQSHANLTLPFGYSRWMKFCRLVGNSECHEYLLGAVKMPNGPFAVMAGKVDGKSVKPSNPNGAVEQLGGPLFLWVGFHSYLSQGGGVPAKTGYVFGLRGHLEFH
jgi:hypothetical protein